MLYMPVTLALKVPSLTLVLAGVSLMTLRRGAPLGTAVQSALVPAAVILAAFLFVRVDIGVRYAAPLFPLFIVLASRSATLIAARASPASAGMVLGLALHVAAALRIAPHDVAFFTDLVGGASQGHRYLSDSNLDWGQDLPALGEWVATTRPERLYLAYFGTAQPEAYGVDGYQPGPSPTLLQPPWLGLRTGPAGGGEYLAVSETNRQGVFYGDVGAYRWLEGRSPVATLGYSILVYDITRDAGAHRALAKMYEQYGPASFAPAERARANAIDPQGSPRPGE